MKKPIIIHCCCGPCSLTPIQILQKNFTVRPIFYNPNISPLEEYEKRHQSFQQTVTHLNLDPLPTPSYDTERKKFTDLALSCPDCYKARLRYTAQIAQENNIPLFTSTLLISPHQDIDLIRNLGHNIAKEFGVSFYDHHPDNSQKKFKGFRPLFTLSHKKAEKLNLYHQEYCGCTPN